MKLRKLFAVILALLVIFSFSACDGSGGGSDDNGGNGGENEDPAAVTWPVIFKAEKPDNPGTYFFIAFNEDGSFLDYDGSLDSAPAGGGDYDGLDPHEDGNISMSGNFEESSINGSFTITDGVLSLFGMNWERQ